MLLDFSCWIFVGVGRRRARAQSRRRWRGSPRRDHNRGGGRMCMIPKPAHAEAGAASGSGSAAGGAASYQTTSSGTSCLISVPFVPPMSSAASFRSPMMAQAPGSGDSMTNSMAAATLGPMDPGNFWPDFRARRYWGVTTLISRPSGLPNFSQMPPPSVRMMRPCAPMDRAMSDAVPSLSTTPSTPTMSPKTRDTGAPPPPAAMTSGYLASRSAVTASSWRMAWGFGLATTRR
mmetsp:Transcript_2022/g.6689  ORF Transcript_2022/g.6689 Transcript_2022/m.6689 type:complete len:233 (-) Transcript_2022:497-1195(-)